MSYGSCGQEGVEPWTCTLRDLRLGSMLVMLYLFAKNDRGNLTRRELNGFRLLARDYEALTMAEQRSMVERGLFIRWEYDGQSKAK